MRRISTCWLGGLALVLVLSTGTKVSADGWLFRRSYYSHERGPQDDGRNVPRSRSAYREPFIGAHPHFAIRGGWRYNNYSIQNGSSTDRMYIRENWFDMNY